VCRQLTELQPERRQLAIVFGFEIHDPSESAPAQWPKVKESRRFGHQGP
jgi:hypothetical protein